MHWTWIADFCGGAFLVNAVPHFVNGVCGRPFPTPFAKPPGRSESPPVMNVLWGSFNAVVAWVLLALVGAFTVHRVGDAVAAGAGGVVLAILLARVFGARHGGQPT